MRIFRNSVVNIEFSLKSDKNNVTLHKDIRTFMMISRLVLLRKTNVSDRVVEKLKHTLCSIIPPPENPAVYETMWNNMVQMGRSQITI